MLGEAALDQKELAPVRAFSRAELAGIRTMLARRLNSPLTSSAGRLFDAVASLTGLRQQTRFEGQAAMELEFALDGIQTDESYPFSIEAPRPSATPDPAPNLDPRPSNLDPRPSHPALPHSALPTPHSALLVDWSPLVGEMIAEVKRAVPAGLISARFHNTLAEIMVAVARRTRQERVVLSGGCFQNRYLTERSVGRLQSEGFRPYWHQRIPPNDGGIALGQVVGALRSLGA